MQENTEYQIAQLAVFIWMILWMTPPPKIAPPGSKPTCDKFWHYTKWTKHTEN